MIRYPYTDFSTINLDWCVARIQELTRNLDWCVARIQELTREVNSLNCIPAPAHPNTNDYLRFDGRKWIAAPLPVYDGS